MRRIQEYTKVLRETRSVTHLVILELLLQHDPELGHRELLLQASQLGQELVRLVRSLPCRVKLEIEKYFRSRAVTCVSLPALVDVDVLH